MRVIQFRQGDSLNDRNLSLGVPCLRPSVRHLNIVFCCCNFKNLCNKVCFFFFAHLYFSLCVCTRPPDQTKTIDLKFGTRKDIP